MEDDWRLQAGEEVDLGDEGPLLLVDQQFLLTRRPASGQKDEEREWVGREPRHKIAAKLCSWARRQEARFPSAPCLSQGASPHQEPSNSEPEAFYAGKTDWGL